MKRIYSVISVLISLATVATAQNNLSQEITVDRTITPVERTATRLSSVNPQTLQYDAQKVTLNPIEYSRSAQLTTSLSFLEPAPWRDSLVVAPWKGYAGIGYLPVYNMWATVGARLVNTRNTTVHAWLQYDGASYKAELAPEYKPAFSWHQGNLGATLAQRFGKKSRLDVALSAMFDGRRMPFNHLTDKKESATAFNGDITAGWKSSLKDIDYHANVEAGMFAFGKDMNFSMTTINPASSVRPFTTATYQTKPARETSVGFGAGAVYKIDGNSKVALDIDGKYVFGNDIEYMISGFMPPIEEPETPTPAAAPARSESLKTAMTDEFTNYGITSLRPRYGFAFGAFTGEVGFKLHILSEGKKKVKMSPDVHFHYVPSSLFGADLDIDGGLEAMTLRRVFEISPYAFRSRHYGTEYTPLNAHLALNFGPIAQGLSASIYGDYNVVRGYLAPSVAFEEDSRINDFKASKLSGWHAGIKVNYACRDYGTAYVRLETASQGENKGYAPWRDRAKYVIGGGVTVTMVENLDLGVDYELRALRRGLVYDPKSVAGVENYASELYTPMNLRNLSNLSLTAAYRINSQLTVFLRGENLLNRSWGDVFSLPEQKIHGLVGVTYKL